MRRGVCAEGVMSCPGSGSHVLPTAEGELICPVCHYPIDDGWWDSAMRGWLEQVPEHDAQVLQTDAERVREVLLFAIAKCKATAPGGVA